MLNHEDIPRIFGRIFNKDQIIIIFDGIINAVGLVNHQAQKNFGTLRVLLANEFFCTAYEVARLEQILILRRRFFPPI